MFGAVTEKPVEGTTEKWQLINLTMDAHPMHMHLVQFQLVSRQNFNAMAYMDDYMSSFPGANGGMGAEGPPFDYNTINSDGAIGGNLPITPYLNGPVMPAQPNERGWKDVILAYPGQIMTYMVRFAPTDLPLNKPKSKQVFGFDPSVGPGYVWHCHIVEHEDNDMMRPMNVQPNPSRIPSKFVPSLALNNTTNGFVMKQNTPNPFSTQTDIKFTIPADIHVQVKLYNYLGAEVKTLLDEDAPAGDHIIRLYSDNLPNGTYFCTLRAGDFTSTHKLVLTR